MTIRLAEQSDVPALVAMGRRFLAASTYKRHLADNPEQMASFVGQLLASPDGAVFVSDVEAQPTGLIALLRFTHPFSGETIVTELAWWVEPEHRGHGVRLVRRAEQWAAEQGATIMQMIAPTTQVGQVYQRLGYERIEASYQRKIA